jgi:hypothetical protein
LIDEEFAPTLGIPILDGRNFSRADGLEARRVAIVSRALARRVGTPPTASR